MGENKKQGKRAKAKQKREKTKNLGLGKLRSEGKDKESTAGNQGNKKQICSENRELKTIFGQSLAWISVIVISLALLGVAVGQYASGGPVPLIVGHPLHVTDIHDDQKLAGISHNVWFGQVDAKTSKLEDKDDEPYTLYSVTVLESLKGTLPARVPVVQYGVDFSNGGKYRVEGDPDLLESGKSYLFVTRTNAAGDEHTVVPGVGNLPLDVAKGANRSTVLESDDANRLRIRFQDAIDNQIEYDPNEGEEPAEGDSTGASRNSSN